MPDRYTTERQNETTGRSMITHRNVRSVRVEYVFDRAGKQTVLVGETDSQLDPAEIDFEPERVEALCKNLELHQKILHMLTPFGWYEGALQRQANRRA